MQTELTIGIIGAMDCEIAKIKDMMSDLKTVNANKLTIYEGKIFNHKVILVKSGVGKVNGALCTQFIIDNFNPNCIINTGIAGGLAADLKIGDIVIGEKLVQHDFDATDLGYAKGYMCTGFGKDKPTVFHSDKTLVDGFEKEVKILDSKLNIHKGIIATGDMFIGNLKRKQDIIETFNATAAEMEGAAIAQTANANNVPCLIIRAIADLADGTVADSIDEMAAEISSNAVTVFLKSL